MPDDPTRMPSARPRVLLVSILTLGRPQNVLRQLADLPGWLVDLGAAEGFSSRIVVRNNDPNVAVDDLAERAAAIEADYPGLRCTLVTDVPNSGFGGGHNANIASEPSDYVLILNDDIGFPHIAWLAEAMAVLRDDPRIACVGGQENPQHLSPLFGNGLLPGAFNLHTIRYAEASVLLFDRSVFDRLGGFAQEFAWAMCEDADLCLRAQQLGYRLAHIAIPHQHWRSTSFNSLPGSVKSSIQEHNRAALFANWRDSFTSGQVGRLEVFDLWGDGVGDLFCSLPHLYARLSSYPPERLACVVVNTRHPVLVDLLRLPGVRVTSIADPGALRVELAGEGIASLRTARDANFSLPFNIHPLLAGTLGIAQADAEDLVRFATLLRPAALPLRDDALTAGTYCVVHLEFDRDHEGRALPPAACAQLLEQCATLFETVVLIGRERRLSPKLLRRGTARVVDLQGSLSLTQLLTVVAGARHFVGIDSFPAHIAAAAGVASAVFFGAIHPLTRAWNEATLWPLTAQLDCIGCYHTHLEPSVPFCMRRDQACTTALPADDMAATLSAMIAGRSHDWSAARLGLQRLQARMLKLTRFHPAPPERLFRSPLASNEQTSELIYRMTEQMGQMLRGQYHSSTVAALTARVQETQADLYEAKIELDELRLKLRQPQAGSARALPKPAHVTPVLHLSSLELEPSRCVVSVDEQWLHVDAFDNDPQLLLPPIVGLGGKVQLQLSYVTEGEETLQVYWATGGEGFGEERMRAVCSAVSANSATCTFPLREGELLLIRIDPSSGRGRSRLRGTLGGAFKLLAPVEPVAIAAEATRPVLIDAGSGTRAFAGVEVAPPRVLRKAAVKRMPPRTNGAKLQQTGA